MSLTEAWPEFSGLSVFSSHPDGAEERPKAFIKKELTKVWLEKDSG